MKKIPFIIASLVVASQSATAQITFQPRVMAGVMDYQFEIPKPSQRFVGDSIKAGDPRPSKQSVSDTMPLLGVGATLSYGANFLDVYYQSTNTGSFDDRDGYTASYGTIVSNVSSGSIDHSDSAIAIGRAFGNFSLTGGYKTGSTEMSQTLNINGNPHKTDVMFDLDGWFIGGAYGIPLGSGALGFTLVYAWLDGEYKNHLNKVNSNDTFRADLSGDTTGLTYGISWKAPITDQWLYALSIDAYNYDFDVQGGAQLFPSLKPGNVQANVEESMVSYRASIIYRF